MARRVLEIERIRNCVTRIHVIWSKAKDLIEASLKRFFTQGPE